MKCNQNLPKTRESRTNRQIIKSFLLLSLFFLFFLSFLSPVFAISAFIDGTATYGIADGTTNHRSSNWVDVDNDGDMDLYVTNNGASNKLYINNGPNQAFTDGTAIYGVGDGTVVHQSASWIDIDRDGDMDLYTSNGYANNHLYINNGHNQIMTDATTTYGLADGTALHYMSAWADVDGDGDLDVYSVQVDANNQLYINNGLNQAFTNATATYGVADGTSHDSANWVDVDNDGDMDLNTAGYNDSNYNIIINNGANQLMTNAKSSYGLTFIGTVWSSSWVDVNNDGKMDIYGLQNSGGILYINNGVEVAMTNATTTYGLADGGYWHLMSSWVDIDNDGDLDMYLIRNSTASVFYLNNGPNQAFTNVTSTYGIGDGSADHRSVSWVDIDNDGDLDLYTVNSGANNHLYINPGQGNNYLKFVVNNSNGLYQYNTRIEVDRDGNNDFSSNGNLTVQYQTNATYAGYQYYSGNSPVGVFFGLGSNTNCIYDVRVFLPGVSPSGTPSYSQQNVCPNQQITIPFNTDDFNYDLTAGVFSNRLVVGTETSSTITYTTDENMSTQADYGTTDNYGSTTTETDITTKVTSHSITISELEKCKVYHYRIKGTDEAGNPSTSTDGTFKTTGCNDTVSTPVSQTTQSVTDTSSGTVVNNTSTNTSVILEPNTVSTPAYVSSTNVGNDTILNLISSNIQLPTSNLNPPTSSFQLLTTANSFYIPTSSGNQYQIGEIKQINLKNSSDNTIIGSSLINKTSIISLKYTNDSLINPGVLDKYGKPIPYPTKYLKLAYSSDGIHWTILSSSVVDPVNNTVSAISKPSGYYMIVGGWNSNVKGKSEKVKVKTKSPNKKVKGVIYKSNNKTMKQSNNNQSNNPSLLQRIVNFFK